MSPIACHLTAYRTRPPLPFDAGRSFCQPQGASLLAPFAYAEMIMAVAAGWYFFGDFPDEWTFVGVGILIACAVYISYRERVRKLPPSVTGEHS